MNTEDLLISLQTDYPAMGSEQRNSLVAAAKGIAKVAKEFFEYTGSEIRFGGPMHIDLNPEYAELYILGDEDFHFYTYAELQEICQIAAMCSLAVDVEPGLLARAQEVESEEQLGLRPTD